MPGNPLRYLHFDVQTGSNFLGAMPYTGVSFGLPQMNAPGPFQGQIALADPGVQAKSWQACTSTSKSALVIDLQGVIVWAGIIWTTNYTEGLGGSDQSMALKVAGQSIGSYGQHRIQADDYSTTWSSGYDPMLIAEQIFNDAMALGEIMGGITVQLNPAGGEGGPLITPSYPATALQTVDSIMNLLSQMGFGAGFDYSYDVAYVAGLPRVTLNFWYPRQGRTADQTQLTVLQKNLLGFTYPVDGTSQGNVIAETGSGTGGIQPAVADASAGLAGYGYPRLELTFSRTQINDEGTLGNIAAADLYVHAWPVVTPTITLPLALPGLGAQPPGAWNLGDFYLGDDLTWLADPWGVLPERAQYGSSPRFPQGMNYEWRTTGWTANVDQQGQPPNLVLNLATPPGEGVPLPPPL